MRKADPKDAKAHQRRLLFGGVLLAAIASFKAHASALLDVYAEDRDAQAFAAAYVEIVVQLHSQAAYAGRGVAATFTGAPVVFGETDEHHGVAVAHQQSEYAAGMRRDMEQGRYDSPEGEFLPERVQSRIDQYANRAHGTANDVMVRSLPQGEGEGYIRWVLAEGAEEDHCDDCPRWAAGGLYTSESLPAVPGDGTSRCKTSCLCSLEVYGIAVPMLARPGRN